MNRRSRWIDVAALLLMSAVVTAPILGPRWFRSHDFIQYPLRLQQLHLILGAGSGLAGWCPDLALGFGLPWFQYFPPAFLLLAEGFHCVGFSLFAALQAAVFAAALLGAAGAYRLGRALHGRSGGLAAAALFTFMPYHLLNLLVRGGLYEFLAQALLPWLLYGLWRSIQDRSLAGAWIAGLATAALGFTHNISALISLPAALLWGLILVAATPGRRGTALIWGLFPLALGLAGSAWFWAPALLTTDQVNLDVMTRGFGDYRHQFIAWWQLLSPYWNFGASIRGVGDSIGFEIGTPALLAALVGLVGGRRTWRRSRTTLAAGLALGLLLAGSALLTHRFSAPLWAGLPLIRFLQFPYRLLALAGLAAALLGSAAPRMVRPERRWMVLAGLLALLTLWSLPRMQVAGFYGLESRQITRELTRSWRETFATGEYVPRNVPDMPPPRKIDFLLEGEPPNGYSREQMEAKLDKALERRPALRFEASRAWKIGPAMVTPQSVQALDPGPMIRDARVDGGGVQLRYEAHRPVRVRCGQFWFPGWRARREDGREIPVEAEPGTGLLLLHLPPGSGSVRAWFGLTPLRLGFRLLSLVAFLGALAGTTALRLSRRTAGDSS